MLLCCCPFGLGDSDRSVFGEDGTEEKGRETRTGRGTRRGGKGKRRRIGGGGEGVLLQGWEHSSRSTFHRETSQSMAV